jgi:hypothetical protein
MFVCSHEPEVVYTDRGQPRTVLRCPRHDLQRKRHRSISTARHDAAAHETAIGQHLAQVLGDVQRLERDVECGANESAGERMGELVVHADSVANICSLTN